MSSSLSSSSSSSSDGAPEAGGPERAELSAVAGDAGASRAARPDPRLKLDGVRLRFPSHAERSLKARMVGWFRPGRRRGRRGTEALVDVDLELRSGDRLGVIGANGSGKTSLLQVMAGIYKPVEGQVLRQGSLVPLLQLGLGFNPELTGRENIQLGAALLGIGRERIRARSDAILDYAGLADSGDTPVKYYSTGMAARLAYTLATEVETDILLLDEVFAVGDIHWVKRAVERLESMLDRIGIVVVASHSAEIILHLCNRCVQLQDGRIVQDGEPEAVLERYRESGGERAPA